MLLALDDAWAGNQEQAPRSDSDIVDLKRSGHVQTTEDTEKNRSTTSSVSSASSVVSYLFPTFSGRWNISTAEAALSARRLSPCSYAAPMNVLNSGCGSNGLDLNSGWNWHPMKWGWSGNSTIST